MNTKQIIQSKESKNVRRLNKIIKPKDRKEDNQKININKKIDH